MAVLNRQMFRRPSALPPLRGPMPVVRETYPVVKRDSGSPKEGEIVDDIEFTDEMFEGSQSIEDKAAGFGKKVVSGLEKLLSNLKGSNFINTINEFIDKPTDQWGEGSDYVLDEVNWSLLYPDVPYPSIPEERIISTSGNEYQKLLQIKDQLRNEMENYVNRAEGSGPHGEDKMRETLLQAIQNFLSQQQPTSGQEILDPFSVVREGEGSMMEKISSLYRQIKQIDPEATAREGEFITRANANIPPDLATMYNNMLQGDIPDSVVREGEFETIFDPNSVVREGEGPDLRFRQAGSPPMGEQVNAENVGIMDGFSEEQSTAMIAEGEAARQQIDNSETYDELMQSTRGDNLSEADRRKELAAYVGEEDAEKTPDSVLALIQPVMQMLNTETANVGIAQVEDGSLEMPTEPVGIAQGGIVGYAMGGAVRKIPKYASGTGSSGVSVEEEQGFGFEASDPYPNTVEFLMNLVTEDTDAASPLRTKYDANYKLFSDILGGDPGADKDMMIGEILSTVVAPLSMAYAQGEPLANVLGQGSKMIGEKALAYDKISKERKAAIKNLALQQALKKADDPLITVYLKDNPDTPDVDESLVGVKRLTSEVIKYPDLYTAESVGKVTADVGLVKKQTKQIEIKTAIDEVDLKYKAILKDLEIEEKDALIDGVYLNNKIQEIVLANKPELLAAELQSINLSNIEKSITNDTLRPKLEAELDQALINIDIAKENLKQEIVTTKYADKLEGFKGDKLKAEIDLLVQEEDFNDNMNVLLLEEKSAEIDNLILTSKNLTLENEYKELENKFKAETYDEDVAAKILENTQKRLENINLSIQNEYLPEEKKLGIDKIKTDLEYVKEQINGQIIKNEKGEIELQGYENKLWLDMQKQMLDIEKLEYDLANPVKDLTQVKVEDTFRKEFNDSSIAKNTEERYMFMGSLIDNANLNTGPGDISFIFQYMKMLDPRSVVREGEFATAASAGGVPASVWKIYNSMLEGDLLSPTVKAQFLEAAYGMFNAQKSLYDDQYEIFKDIATERGFNVDSAVPYFPFDQNLLTRWEKMFTLTQPSNVGSDTNSTTGKEMKKVWSSEANNGEGGFIMVPVEE